MIRSMSALGPRELNPDDADLGTEHLRFLENLMPDYVVLPGHGIPFASTSLEEVLRRGHRIDGGRRASGTTAVSPVSVLAEGTPLNL